MQQVSPKILRSLLARSFNLVRNDIPTKTVEVDFQTLEHAAEQEGNLERLLGITTLNTPHFNANYPYNLSMVAEAMSLSSWHASKRLIQQIEEDKGVDICKTDNAYHVKVKTGKKSEVHKYSQALVDLLTAVKAGDPYELKKN